MKRLQIPQKLVYENFYLHEKILGTRNCRLKFIKNLLFEKRKENTETKQPRFKSRLNNNYDVLFVAKLFFREFVETIGSYYFREIEMCHFREIEICHFGEITILQFSRD